jgi:preprotein translocase subunit SecF
MSTEYKPLLTRYLVQKGYQDWFFNANKLRFELMEVEGVEVRVREKPSKKDLQAIRSKALSSFVPDECLQAADDELMSIIDSTSSTKSSAKKSKQRLRKDLQKQRPEFYTDESKQAISNEFIQKFLTL